MSEEKKPEKTLNAGQQAACDGFFQFLFSDQKELIISGAGGVGKTFLMGYLIDEILPRYFDTCSIMEIEPEYHHVEMAATTNKAAEVLSAATGRPTSTIHSLLGLKVKENFKTGKTELIKTPSWNVQENTVLFVDEASMIDRELRSYIQQGTFKSKVIYVGDHSQLPPVFEDLSPIYLDGLPFFELIEPMRNATQPALMGLCQQLRDTVATGIFKPIRPVPGVIDYLTPEEAEEKINEYFVEGGNGTCRILAYTNAQVNALNDYLRGQRNLPTHFTRGEHVISNNAVQMPSGGSTPKSLSVEEEVEIVEVADTAELIKVADTEFYARKMAIKTGFGQIYYDVLVPEDKHHFNELVKYFARQKDWFNYFRLKQNYPDLRPIDACTVHKSQGSTYDTVFIDMENLSTCTQPKLAARLLYVAFTRAKFRIYMYGKLTQRFGGIEQ